MAETFLYYSFFCWFKSFVEIMFTTNSQCFRGCYFEEAGKVNLTMDVMEAFRRSLQTWKAWVLENLDPQRTHVFFRSYSPVHYRQVCIAFGL